MVKILKSNSSLEDKPSTTIKGTGNASNWIKNISSPDSANLTDLNVKYIPIGRLKFDGTNPRIMDNSLAIIEDISKKT